MIGFGAAVSGSTLVAAEDRHKRSSGKRLAWAGAHRFLVELCFTQLTSFLWALVLLWFKKDLDVNSQVLDPNLFPGRDFETVVENEIPRFLC